MKHWLHHRERMENSWEGLVMSGHAVIRAMFFFRNVASTTMVFKGENSDASCPAKFIF